MKKWISITVIFIGFCINQLNAQQNVFEANLNKNKLPTDSLPLSSQFLLIDSFSHLLSYKAQRLNQAHTNFPQAAEKKLIVLESNLKNNLNKQLAPFIALSNKKIATVNTIIKKPLTLNVLEINYNGLSDSSYINNGTQYIFNELSLKSDWTIAQIPVRMNYQLYQLSNGSNYYNTPFALNYVRDSFFSQLKKKHLSDVELSSLIPDLHDPLNSIKKQADDSFKSQLQKLNTDANNLLSDEIKNIGGVEALVKRDIDELKGKFLNESVIQQFNFNNNLYNQLLAKRNMGEIVNQLQLNELEQSIKKFKALNKLIKHIEKSKNQWESSGLIKQMNESELLKKAKAEEFLNNPSNFSKLAKEKFSLNSLQKLFLKIDKLDLGQNTVSKNELSLNHFLNNGIVTRFANKNKHSTFILSQVNELRSIWDANFTSNLHANNSSVKGGSFGKGTVKSNSSNISFMSFDQSLSTIQQAVGLRNLKQTLVTSFSKQIEIGRSGRLNAELSKSASTYAGVDQQKAKNNIESLLSIENLLSNTAFRINYTDNLPHINFNYHLELGSTSIDYTNPGNNYLNSGSKELGAGFKKSLLQKRLQISARTKLRTFDYSKGEGNTWLNTYGVYDLRWKLNRSQFITLRYLPNSMIRYSEDKREIVSLQRRLSAETSLTYKKQRFNYRNYVNVAYQQNEFLFVTDPIASTTYSISSFQNFNINKRHLFITTNYNYATNNSQFLYFNSSLVTEAGTTYLLFKKISGSSSIGYNSIQQWYQQIGLRQTLSGSLGKNLTTSLFIDARKNLNKYSDLYISNFRASVSLHYTFKN